MDPNSDDLQHTQVAGDPGSARGLWPLLTSGISARYAFEGISETVKRREPERAKRLAMAAIAPLRAYVEETATDEPSRAAALKLYSKLRPALSKEEAVAKLEALRQSRRDAIAAGATADSWAPKAIEDFLGFGADASPAQGNAHEIGELLRFKAKFLEDKFQSAIGSFAKDALDRRADYLYDIPLGFGSAAITTVYASHVAKNMDNLFAEAVGYETGKDPHGVTLNDLRHSDNHIVADTWRNFEMKNVERYATDAVFAGRLLEHVPGLEKAGSLPFGKFGIAGKAMMLFSEIFRHQKTTMFEDLVTLVDKKLNPEHGIGQPITAADMASLFQKYASSHKREAPSPLVNWVRAEPMFEEMAKAMNATYQDKYLQMGTGHKAEGADFVLPKLIYLLGHDLIDPNKPDRTLAFVQAASEQGIGSVKALQAKLVDFPVPKGVLPNDAPAMPADDPLPLVAGRPLSPPANDRGAPGTRVSQMMPNARLQDAARIVG